MTHTVKVGDQVRVLVNHEDYGLHPQMICTIHRVDDGIFSNRPFCDVVLPDGKLIRGIWQSRFEVVS